MMAEQRKNQKQMTTSFWSVGGLLQFSFVLLVSPITGARTEVLKTSTEPVTQDLISPLSPLTNIRQMSWVGPRSGEAYFSADGRKIIFQSERHQGNPFYQIYEWDLEKGRLTLISTGQGKTTCAWYHPSGKKALFSSTHLDPQFQAKVKQELEERAAPVKGKYSWSFDEWFDIFEFDLNTKKYRRLTQAKGYDAEGSYSPDGQWILFASNRHAYTEPMTDYEKKLFEKDPSSQMELYIMRADGSGVRRLTRHLGYDGGPFFSPDGQRIVWRRFNELGTLAEIWTARVDGSEAKALTNFQAMSWAPFYHPSGDYIIFTTNKLGYSNFELYIVDSEGKREPVRVSYLDDFDGLPVFSPDGNQLLWSHKNKEGESQLYLADWDDLKARELLQLPPRLPKGAEWKAAWSPHLKTLQMERAVKTLAHPYWEGRLTGHSKEKKLADQLASTLRDLGLGPVQNPSLLHPFSFTQGVELLEGNNLQTSSGALKLNDEWRPYPFSPSGDFAQAPVVFAGYGLVAPGNESLSAYDSYSGLDVTGKWVVVFRDFPQDLEGERRLYLSQFARLHHKALLAKERGALGLIVVRGPRSFSKKELADLKSDTAGSMTSIPVVSVTDKVAESWFKAAGWNMKEVQARLDKGELLSGPFKKDFHMQLSLRLQDKKATGYNVVAGLVTSPQKPWIILGAHFDHLGRGETGTSLAKGDQVGQIHLGADDNASGVVLLLSLAAEWSEKKAWPINLAFAFWSGEEMGTLGSQNFLASWKGPMPLFYVNFDMVGRLREKLTIGGVGSAKEWREWLEPSLWHFSKAIELQNDAYLPTDALSFYLKGVPVLSFYTQSHQEYHTPADRAELISMAGMRSIEEWFRFWWEHEVLTRLSTPGSKAKVTRGPVLTYVKQEGSKSIAGGARSQFRVYLGTIPDYTQDKSVQGVKISGTSKNSPAEKAGLKDGDIITQLAGRDITNIYDYVYMLQSLKPREPIKVKVKRGERLVELELTPELKE